MKKTLSIVIIALLTLVMSMTAVYATTSFAVALSASATKVAKGEEVIVTVSLKNFTAGETGINALRFTLDYDKTVFEAVEAANMTTASGWSTPVFNAATGEGVTDNSSFIAENHDMLKIKFVVKSTATVGNTVITVKDVEASDSASEIYPSDQKITLTIQETAATNTVQNTVQNTTPAPTQNVATENPTTGFEDFTVPAILAISVLGIIAYVRYRKLDK